MKRVISLADTEQYSQGHGLSKMCQHFFQKGSGGPKFFDFSLFIINFQKINFLVFHRVFGWYRKCRHTVPPHTQATFKSPGPFSPYLRHVFQSIGKLYDASKHDKSLINHWSQNSSLHLSLVVGVGYWFLKIIFLLKYLANIFRWFIAGVVSSSWPCQLCWQHPGRVFKVVSFQSCYWSVLAKFCSHWI